MQDRYAGDIGDFGKFALLRCLSPGHKLGVGWYKTAWAGQSAGNDGKHISYLDYPDKFRWLEPEVFDALKIVVNSSRSISALQETGLLPSATFHDDEVPRNSLRPAWTQTLKRLMSDRDLIFLDPDNGIQGQKLSPKHISLSEIQALRQNGRALVVYHHQRRKKAHMEAAILAKHVNDCGWSPVEVIRFRMFSSRFYVIAGHDAEMSRRIAQLARQWGTERIEHFPIAVGL